MAFIYKIVVGDETYVGQTTDLKTRVKQHISNAYSDTYHKKSYKERPLSNAIKNLGLKNTIFYMNDNKTNYYGIGSGEEALTNFSLYWHHIKDASVSFLKSENPELNFAEICYIVKNRDKNLLNITAGGNTMYYFIPEQMVKDLIKANFPIELEERIKNLTGTYVPQAIGMDMENKLIYPEQYLLKKSFLEILSFNFFKEEKNWIRVYVEAINKVLSKNTSNFADLLKRNQIFNKLTREIKDEIENIIRTTLFNRYRSSIMGWTMSLERYNIKYIIRPNFIEVNKSNFEGRLVEGRNFRGAGFKERTYTWVREMLKQASDGLKQKIVNAILNVNKGKQNIVKDIKIEETDFKTIPYVPEIYLPKFTMQIQFQTGEEQKPSWYTLADANLENIKDGEKMIDQWKKEWLVKDFQSTLKNLKKKPIAILGKPMPLLNQIWVAYRNRGIAPFQDFGNFEVFYHIMMGITFNAEYGKIILYKNKNDETLGITRPTLLGEGSHGDFERWLLIKKGKRPFQTESGLRRIMKINNQASLHKLDGVKY